MQKGRWVDQFGLRIVPFEARPDAARWQGGPIYRVKDVFTTRDGSWEVSDVPGSIDQWAKDAYFSGAKFDGAGGDHNFFIMTLDEAGKPIPGKGLLFWQGDMSPNFVPSDPRTAKQDGTENIPVFGSYVPERGEHGSWSGAALGRSDVLVGVGMPANWHVSTFLVLQAVADSGSGGTGSGGTGTGGTGTSTDTEAILKAIAGVAEQVRLLSKHLGL